MRKSVLKYDDVMNRQREVIYRERREVLEGEDISELVQNFLAETLTAYVSAATASGFPEQWDLQELWKAVTTIYPISFTIDDVAAEVHGLGGLDHDFLLNKILSDAKSAYAARENSLTPGVMRELERKVLLSVLDRKWREHLYEMDYLQEGIGLRAMAQRDPLVEYQKEGFDLFAAMSDAIKEELVGLLFHVEVDIQMLEGAPAVEAKGIQAPAKPAVNQLRYTAADVDGQVVQSGGTARNAPCPCGSGKKYKRCHGA